MKANLKRALSSILAIVMMLSLVYIPANAITDPSQTTLVGGSVAVDGTSSKTVIVSWKINEADTVEAIEGRLPTSLADGKIVLTAFNFDRFTKGENDYANISSGRFKYASFANRVSFAAGEELFHAVYTVAADTPTGTYPVELYVETLTTSDYGFDVATLETSIVVTKPTAQPEWELYYKLDPNKSDTDGDKYIEYNPGETVTATIYMKAKADDVLQAVDFYVTNDANLHFENMTSTIGAVRVESGTNASTDTSQHIQVVGSSKDKPINVTMGANTEVAIATITYTVKDSAIYNTNMPITIEDTANFAVQNNPDSFVPEIQTFSSDTLGVETLKTYTVTYDENKPTAAAAAALTVNGMPDPLTANKEHNVDYTVAAAPSLANYTFDGWNTAEDGTGNNYPAGNAYTANENVTLYAQWTADTHKVEWKHQDGAGVYETDNAVAFGTNLSYDGAAPTKKADAQYTYTFVGWSTEMNADTGAPANSFTMGSADMVLYAAFSKVTNEYTVTWKSQDGETTYETDANVPYGQKPSFNGTQPAKANDKTYSYKFAGWATSINQKEGTPAGDLSPVTGPIEYFAAFSETYIDYTINYALGDHPAGNQAAPDTVTKHYDDKITLPNGPTPATGWVFSGWYDGTKTYEAGKEYTVTGNATLTAQYTEKTYTIHYDGNSNTSGTAPADQTGIGYTNTAVVLAAKGDLLRSGYTFQGWNTKADGTGTNFSGTVAMSALEPFASSDTNTVTLYAKWGTEEYTITYNYDGGALPVTDPATTNPGGYNANQLPIKLIRPVKAGYSFVNWTIEVASGEEGAVVAEGDWIQKNTWGNLTVKANWEEATAPFTVKYFQQNIDNDNYSEMSNDTIIVTNGITGQKTNTVFTPASDKYAGFHLSTIAGKNDPITILADGTAVLNVYYDRNIKYVTYSYTGDIPDNVPPVPARVGYRYGAPYIVADNPTLAGYDFSNWSITGNQTMGLEDVTITGSWTAHVYTITFKDENGTPLTNQGSDNTFTILDSSITPPPIPEKPWYDGVAWTGYDTRVLEDQDATPTYTEHEYTITWTADGKEVGSDTFKDSDRNVTTPVVPPKAGYTGTWSAEPDTNSPSDQQIEAIYTAIEYTITLELDGGTGIATGTDFALNGTTGKYELKYTIEDGLTLPAATGKTNHSFVKWVVQEPAPDAGSSNWGAAGTAYNAAQYPAGKYGHVMLKAEWTVSLNYNIDDYKYAPTGYKLLIVDAANVGTGNVYQYNGQAMYYTTDANYMITKDGTTSTAVFYTLVQDDATAAFNVGMIAAAAGEQKTITYDGDINSDGKVNIADANAIFQMVVNGGRYYPSLDQLSIAQRLAADMVKTTVGAEYRGSIEDVNAVVDKINGVTN